MHPALWISKSGLDGQQSNISIISNNLSNVNTVGFKKDRGIFQDLIYQNIRQPGGDSANGTRLPSGLMVGTGVRLAATQKDYRAGNPLRTDNSLDLTIDGRGFFQIEQPDGTTAYTRDGKFHLTEEGLIVTAEGQALQPEITIPPSSISISIGKDGIVSVLLSGNTTPQQVGTIQTVDFINPAGLQPVGDNLLTETASSGTPVAGTPASSGYGSLIQGTLESSNVNVVEELVNLIQTQRAYEINAKAVETVDSMLQFVAQVL